MELAAEMKKEKDKEGEKKYFMNHITIYQQI